MLSKSSSLTALVVATVFSSVVNANPVNVHHARNPEHKPAPGGWAWMGHAESQSSLLHEQFWPPTPSSPCQLPKTVVSQRELPRQLEALAATSLTP